MSLFNTIMKLCNVSTEIAPSDYRVMVFDNRSLHMEGVKQVLSLSSDEISIKTARNVFILQGKGLKVEKLCDGDLVVSGDIWGLNKK